VTDFEGLVAVVTGGVSGIGAATARRLQSADMVVINGGFAARTT
jgi:NADP-dependent 3-hydroxy acid dehydrogenase YdfG